MTYPLKTVTLEVPDMVDAFEARMMIFSSLFNRGILSSGQAAKMVNLSRVEFLEKVGDYGVTIFGETEEDLDKVIEKY